MRRTKRIEAFGWILAALTASACGQTETFRFFFGTNAYPAAILDRPRLETEADHPELFLPPAIGDSFACRVYRDRALARELAGTVVSPTVLACANGPEIAVYDDLRIDLLRALYMTDVLHRSPQTLEEGPPWPPLPPPTFDVLEIRPAPP